MLLKSIHIAFSGATSNAEDLLSPFLELNASPFDPQAAPTRERLLSRTTKLVENMLRWRKYTGDRHDIDKMCVRLLNDWILPVAESGWEVGGERKVSQVTNSVLCRSASSYSILGDGRFATGISELSQSDDVTAMTTCYTS